MYEQFYENPSNSCQDLSTNSQQKFQPPENQQLKTFVFLNESNLTLKQTGQTVNDSIKLVDPGDCVGPEKTDQTC